MSMPITVVCGCSFAAVNREYRIIVSHGLPCQCYACLWSLGFSGDKCCSDMAQLTIFLCKICMLAKVEILQVFDRLVYVCMWSA